MYSHNRHVVQDFRPDEIILAYWKELLPINEEDILLSPEFLEYQHPYQKEDTHVW